MRLKTVIVCLQWRKELKIERKEKNNSFMIIKKIVEVTIDHGDVVEYLMDSRERYVLVYNCDNPRPIYDYENAIVCVYESWEVAFNKLISVGEDNLNIITEYDWLMMPSINRVDYLTNVSLMNYGCVRGLLMDVLCNTTNGMMISCSYLGVAYDDTQSISEFVHGLSSNNIKCLCNFHKVNIQKP